MELKVLPAAFAVCRLAALAGVDYTQEFVFVAKTDDELSLVCDEAAVPATATDVERGWRAMKITGVLDFGMVGVIARISAILAAAQIPLFVVSTYNTDYILVKQEKINAALGLLAAGGYTIRDGDKA